MVAQWHLDLRGEDEAGTLGAAISNLQNQSGEPLMYTDLDAGAERQRGIEQIVFGGVGIRVDSESRLYFEDDQPGVLTIRIGNQDPALILHSDPTVSSSIEGKFLGRAPDGPQGAIGIWTLRASGDARIGVGDRLYGAFGVEFRP